MLWNNLKNITLLDTPSPTPSPSHHHLYSFLVLVKGNKCVRWLPSTVTITPQLGKKIHFSPKKLKPQYILFLNVYKAGLWELYENLAYNLTMTSCRLHSLVNISCTIIKKTMFSKQIQKNPVKYQGKKQVQLTGNGNPILYELHITLYKILKGRIIAICSIRTVSHSVMTRRPSPERIHFDFR